MQLYINCNSEYIEEQRKEQREIMKQVLTILPEAEIKQDTCYKCGFKGLCKLTTEQFKKLEESKISYTDAWIFNNENTTNNISTEVKKNKQICDVCNNIEITQREIKEKEKAINKYMRELAKPKYICQVCRYKEEYFNTKQELKLHLQKEHESYYIKKELD